MDAWQIINLILSGLFVIIVLYQVFYIFIGFFAKTKYPTAKVNHKYGILIAGRNEEKVIGQLLDSIKKQNYPIENLKIFVVADNCSKDDKTAQISREMGAIVYERFNTEKVSKSYALDFLLKNIASDYPDYNPDGWFIFDADNLLDENYIKEMNKAFDAGKKIVTSYRNSKNYGDSLFSMGSSIHFIRECRFLHNPRNFLGFSTHISGTGFLVANDILNLKTGWKYGKLTEDLEFSCDNLIKGNSVAYCDDAIFYDEQPSTWKQTYRQRLRWQKGSYQCAYTFLFNLLFRFVKNLNFAFYDFFVFFLPLPLVSTSWGIVNLIVSLVQSIIQIASGGAVRAILLHLLLYVVSIIAIFYLGTFLYGAVAVLRDWKRIKAKSWKKIVSMFAFPIFMLTLVPICFIALFKKVEWAPIKHDVSKNIDDVQSPNKKRV